MGDCSRSKRNTRLTRRADAYDAVLEAVESGEIPRERIEASVERILEVKQDYSLGDAGVR